jgi:outer membrane protein OmpA-like peptidoglycan-associated protein
MKKLILIPALMLGTMAMAAQKPKYEISPMIGYNLAEGNLNFKDDGHVLGGLEFQFNTPKSKISPEFSILYSPGADYEGRGDTDVMRAAFNGVYDFDTEGSSLVPFVKAGFGFEKVSSENEHNENGPFVDAGAGLKMFFTKNIALKLEAIYMAKFSSPNAGIADNNLVGLAGLTFAFGGEERAAPVDGDDDNDGVLNSIDKCPATISGATVDTNGCAIDGDDDKDGVANSIDECPTTIAGATVDAKGCTFDDDNDGVFNADDKCPNTPAGTTVDAKGCKVDGDDDNDGVLNSVDECPTTPAGVSVDAKGCTLDDDNDGVINTDDKCPNTPAGAKVDMQGCMLAVNLHINFKHDSYEVDSQSDRNIQNFVDFLKASPIYDAQIIGYTDSLGKASYNKKLSQRRADAVKAIIVKKGVSADRISTVGMGEDNPVATNSTKAGRAQNRRIEAKLISK